MIEFFVAGTPITQGSKKLGRAGRLSTIIETRDAELKPWREGVAAEARAHAAGRPGYPLAGPVSARSGDIDKLSRAILDAITGVLIADDSQVVSLLATKDFGRPGVNVCLRIVADDTPGAFLPLEQVTA